MMVIPAGLHVNSYSKEEILKGSYVPGCCTQVYARLNMPPDLKGHLLPR